MAPEGKNFPRHCHRNWEFVYYLSGNIDCVMDEVTFEGHPGLLWMTPPEQHHAETAHTAYRNLNFTVDLPASLGLPLYLEDDPEGCMGQLCRQIVVEVQHRRLASSSIARLLVETLLHYVDRAQKREQVSPSESVVRRAEACLDERYAQEISLEEIARECGVSSASLRSYFQSLRGYSPRDYLKTKRIEQARYLLQTSTLTLDAISELTGFYSASHLSRMFKQRYQTSPGSVRRL